MARTAPLRSAAIVLRATAAPHLSQLHHAPPVASHPGVHPTQDEVPLVPADERRVIHGKRHGAIARLRAEALTSTTAPRSHTAPAAPYSAVALCFPTGSALTRRELAMARCGGWCRAASAAVLLIAASCAGRADSACPDGDQAIATRAGVLCAEEEAVVVRRALLQRPSQEASPAEVPFPSCTFAVAPRLGSLGHGRISSIASAGAGASLPLEDGSFGGWAAPQAPVACLPTPAPLPSHSRLPPRAPAHSAYCCRPAAPRGVPRRGRRRPRPWAAPFHRIVPIRPEVPAWRWLRGRGRS